MDASPTLTLAKLYEKQGLLRDAAEVYKKLIAREPERSDVREGLETVEAKLQKRGARDERGQENEILMQLERWHQAVLERKKDLLGQVQDPMKILVVWVPDEGRSGPAAPDAPAGLFSEEGIRAAAGQDVRLEVVWADDETLLAELLARSVGRYDAVIVNPGGLEGSDRLDALPRLDIPVMEVHFSNPSRAPVSKTPLWRLATAHLAGFGEAGLALAVQAAADMVRQKRANSPGAETQHRFQ